MAERPRKPNIEAMKSFADRLRGKTGRIVVYDAEPNGNNTEDIGKSIVLGRNLAVTVGKEFIQDSGRFTLRDLLYIGTIRQRRLARKIKAQERVVLFTSTPLTEAERAEIAKDEQRKIEILELESMYRAK